MLNILIRKLKLVQILIFFLISFISVNIISYLLEDESSIIKTLGYPFDFYLIPFVKDGTRHHGFAPKNLFLDILIFLIISVICILSYNKIRFVVEKYFFLKKKKN